MTTKPSADQQAAERPQQRQRARGPRESGRRRLGEGSDTIVTVVAATNSSRDPPAPRSPSDRAEVDVELLAARQVPVAIVAAGNFHARVGSGVTEIGRVYVPSGSLNSASTVLPLNASDARLKVRVRLTVARHDVETGVTCVRELTSDWPREREVTATHLRERRLSPRQCEQDARGSNNPSCLHWRLSL